MTARLRETAQLREALPSERQRVLEIVIELAGRVRGRRVLDLGAESSALARLLAEQGATVESARDLLEPSSPLKGPFDLVTAAHCIDDAKDPEIALRVAAKLLHPRGRIVLAIAHPWRTAEDGATLHPALASLPALLASLRSAGLRLVDAAEPPADSTATPDTAAPRHLILVAERTGRRTRNRGTSG